MEVLVLPTLKKKIDELGKTTNKRKVACRLRIQQRMIDPYTNESYKPLFNNIARFLGVNLLVVTRSTGKQYFSLEAKSRESLSIIKNYFNTYPLFSSKYHDFLDWETVVNLILCQTHYDNENSDLIEKLKSGMNNSRSNINWEHLDRLGVGKKNRVLLSSCLVALHYKQKGKNLKACSNNYINKFNKLNVRHYSTGVNYNQFGSYLAGLFEGDGHIWIQNPDVGYKKKHNPRFCITFSLKNEPLAKKLLDIIESGFIRYKPKDNACVLVVSPVVGLKKIVYLINGELRTPKIHQLYKLMDWLNKHHSANIDKLPLKESPLANDSWLSGFIDSDGSFSVQHTKVKNNASLRIKRKISCRLRIEQRMLDPVTGNSYLDILTTITKFLNCSLLTRTQKSTGNEYYTLTASSKYSTEILVNYLDKYPLFSSKYLDYRDWKEIVLLIFENKHRVWSDETISYVASIKNNMNTKRNLFNWDHLDLLSFSPKGSVTIKYPYNYALSSLTVSKGNSTLNRPLLNVPSTLSVRGLNKINNREYSTVKKINSSLSTTIFLKNNVNLENFYVSGFCDADSSFSVSVLKKSNMKTGWTASARLIITLHKKDVDLLYRIQFCLGGVGTISVRNNSDVVDFVVGSVVDLVNIVIPFFSKYPLITRKRADFILFNKAVELINKKEHLTLEGLQKIVNLKASMNKGLTDGLEKAFPNTKPILRPVIERSFCIINPWWLTGFIEGEGSFSIGIRKSTSHNTGYQVSLIFHISQHLKDVELMKDLIKYFQAGGLIFRKEHPLVVYQVIKFSEIEEKVIPFLNKYPLQGVKRLVFEDWKKAAAIVKTKGHLTLKGLEEIKKIKDGMNAKRSL